jgi:hypothetical protein
MHREGEGGAWGEKAEGVGQLRMGDGALKFRFRVQEISSTSPPLFVILCLRF